MCSKHGNANLEKRWGKQNYTKEGMRRDGGGGVRAKAKTRRLNAVLFLRGRRGWSVLACVSVGGNALSNTVARAVSGAGACGYFA